MRAPRLPGQSQQGLEYTELLRAKVDRIIVMPVLQVGDWRPIKGKYK